MTTDTSLVVPQQRHLQLPDSCLFAPTELQIGSEISQTEFSRLGKALASVDQASDLWACDYALAGQERWGDDGLKLAATATKLSVGYLKTGARIAARFDPSRRFPDLTREHYRGICCFPVEFTDAWLPTVVEKGFGAKTLRALAVKAFGSDPKEGYTRKQNRKRAVSIPLTLYALFQERSPIPKVAVFIEQVLEDWLSTATPEQQARVAAALLTREEVNHQRRRAERNRVKAEKLAAKLAARDKREAEKRAAIIAKEQRVAALRAAQAAKRPTRAERRAAQKKYKSKIAIAFTECKGRGRSSVAAMRVDAFHGLQEALDAAREYSLDRGYIVLPFMCPRCNNGHPIWHLRAAEEVDLSKEQAEVQATVRAFVVDICASLREAAQKTA